MAATPDTDFEDVGDFESPQAWHPSATFGNEAEYIEDGGGGFVRIDPGEGGRTIEDESYGR